MRNTIAILLCIIALSLQAQAGESPVTIHVKNLKSAEGKLGFRVYNASEEVIHHEWVEVTGTEMTVVIDVLEPGTYAIQYFHDANDNDELDFKWYGAPDEGTGNSNNIKGTFGPPDFEKQLFELEGPMTLDMKTVHY